MRSRTAASTEALLYDRRGGRVYECRAALSRRLRRHLNGLTLALMACGGSEPVRIMRGDTTVVRVPPGQVVVSPDTIRTIWRDSRLEDPISISHVDTVTMVVGDRMRVHVLRQDGSHVGTYGRSGRGPGEFGSITAVTAHDDGVIVLDARNRRVTVLDISGLLLDTQALAWPYPFVNVQGDGQQVAVWDGGVLSLYAENRHTDRRTRVALIWQSLAGDSTEVLQTWRAEQWMDTGTLVVPVSAFGPKAVVAIARDGRVAYGDGLEWCVSMQHIAQTDVLRICVDTPRAHITQGVEGTPVGAVDLPAHLRDAFASAIAHQDIEEFFPSYDRLVFGEDGTLWVRTVGADAPDIHPLLRYWAPDKQPANRRWQAIERTGVLGETLLLPTSFQPQLFYSERAVGFREMPNGEVVVAEVRWSGRTERG